MRKGTAVAALLGATVLALAACGGDDEESAAETTTAAATTAAQTTTTAPEEGEISFVELEFYESPSGRGPKGMATLKDEGGRLTVTIKLIGAPPEQPPAHIHRGLCEYGRPDAKLGDVVYPLNNIVGGLSETSIDVPLAYFETPDQGTNKHAIDVHMAEGQDLCTDISFGG